MFEKHIHIGTPLEGRSENTIIPFSRTHAARLTRSAKSVESTGTYGWNPATSSAASVRSTGRIERFSVDTLVAMLGNAGARVELVVKPRSRVA